MSSEKGNGVDGFLGLFALIMLVGLLIFGLSQHRRDSLNEAEYQGFIAGRIGINQEDNPKIGDWKDRWLKGWERGNSERKDEK